MHKLKIAIIMEDCRPDEGGGYSYYQTLLSAIDRHAFHHDLEIVHINFDESVGDQLNLSKQVIKVKKTFVGALAYLVLKQLYRLVHYLFKKNARVWLENISGIMDSIKNNAAKKFLKRENIHLIYYLKPQDSLIDYPMVVTHWDVGHKSMYPFPEVVWHGNFEKRENYYRKILSKAFLILCESNTGSKELQKYYPVNPDKIRVLPLFGGNVLNQNVSEEDQKSILLHYKLVTGSFYIYPAQFWAHKNHSTLLYAFKSLLQERGNESLKLVLCGGDQGNLLYVKELINTLSLNSHIILPGFIANKNLYALYLNAIALVMPTFLGPTNIPLIEAAQLKCAVLCSNLKGHKEILGDNALYFDPSNAMDIKNCLQDMLDDKFRKQLKESAYEHIKNSSFQVEKSIPLLDRFLQEIMPVRGAWGMNLKLLFAFAEIGTLVLTNK